MGRRSLSSLSCSLSQNPCHLCVGSSFWSLSSLNFTLQQRLHSPQTYSKYLPLSPLRAASRTVTNIHLLAHRTRLLIALAREGKKFQEHDNRNRLLTKSLRWTSMPCRWKSYNLQCQSKESNRKNAGKRKWHLVSEGIGSFSYLLQRSLTLSTPSLAQTGLTFNTLHPTPSLSKLQNCSTLAPAIWALIHRLHLPDLLSLNPYLEM